jgi:hypothetical protein
MPENPPSGVVDFAKRIRPVAEVCLPPPRRHLRRQDPEGTKPADRKWPRGSR